MPRLVEARGCDGDAGWRPQADGVAAATGPRVPYPFGCLAAPSFPTVGQTRLRSRLPPVGALDAN
jgi:hypothetical protein